MADIERYNQLLGEELRINRILKKKSLQDVADGLGLHKNTIGYYERGIIPMTALTVKNYCDYLGIDYIEVFKKVSEK